jgi:hypothetical protein
MVGSTNGTVTNALSQTPAFPDVRAINAAHGIAIATVTTVDAAACQVVNQMASLVRDESKISRKPVQPWFNELTTILMTG